MNQVLKRDAKCLPQHLKEKKINCMRQKPSNCVRQIKKKDDEGYRYNTWINLWMWRLTFSLEGMPESALRSSANKCVMRLRQDQTSIIPNTWWPRTTFSLPLSTTCCLLGRGVISSTEVAREATLVVSGTEVIGVIGVSSWPPAPPSSRGSRGARSSWPSS